MNTVTFVSCMVHIYEKEPFEHKTVDWRIDHFKMIADLGVNICLYGCEVTLPLLKSRFPTDTYPNVRIMETIGGMTFKETTLHKMCYKPGLTYPQYRNDHKDTTEYMALMHAKIEFVHDAIRLNPFGTEVFSWIDFSMAYIFLNKVETLNKLKRIGTMPYMDMPFMAIPGCWSQYNNTHVESVLNRIHWRFCGTFFIGDKSSLERFYDIYLQKYPVFLETYNKIVWEVNFWSWLESNSEWCPLWYSSDHNDRIIDIPSYLQPSDEL